MKRIEMIIKNWNWLKWDKAREWTRDCVCECVQSFIPPLLSNSIIIQHWIQNFTATTTNSYGSIMLQSTHGFCIVIILHTFCQLYTHPQANTLDGNRLSDLKANDIGVSTLPYTQHAARTHSLHTNKASICLSSKICIHIRAKRRVGSRGFCWYCARMCLR